MDKETEARINALHDMLMPQDDFKPGNLCERKSSCVAQGNCQRAVVIFRELRNKALGLDDILADIIGLNPSCVSQQYEEVMRTVGQIYPDVP